MKTTVFACDRCKKKTDELIEFTFINQNVELQPEENRQISFFDCLGTQKRYPTMDGELCYDCVMEISRWLGHQENCLTSKMNVGEPGGKAID